MLFSSNRVNLNVEKINKFINIVVLRSLSTFNVFDYDMLVELKIIIEESLLNIAEEDFYNLSYPVVLLWAHTLVYFNNWFCDLALLARWLHHPSLDSSHARFHILNIPSDLHSMGFMLILLSLEEDLKFNIDWVYW